MTCRSHMKSIAATTGGTLSAFDTSSHLSVKPSPNTTASEGRLYISPGKTSSPYPKGSKVLLWYKVWFCSSNFPHGFWVSIPHGSLGSFGYKLSSMRCLHLQALLPTRCQTLKPRHPSTPIHHVPGSYT